MDWIEEHSIGDDTDGDARDDSVDNGCDLPLIPVQDRNDTYTWEKNPTNRSMGRGCSVNKIIIWFIILR